MMPFIISMYITVKLPLKKKGFKSVLGFGHTVFTEGGLEILSLRHDIRQFGYSDHF